MREYDVIADWYASRRGDTAGATGIPEVAALASSISRGSRVLDIGCGHGIPLTRVLLDAGHRVVGLDSSGRMLARFRVNFPGTPVVRGVVQTCAFASRSFDVAIAWGVLFHLNQPDQMRALASVSRILKAGAPFLFTSGDVDRPVPHEGTMNDVVFRYWSFSVDGYRRVLGERGFTLSSVHQDGGGNTYYLARKSA